MILESPKLDTPKDLSIPTFISSLDSSESAEYPHVYFSSGFMELSGPISAL